MAAYFIAQINVHDPAGYQRYLNGTSALLEAHSGRVLAVDTEPTVLEGEWPYGRTVLIEFPSEDALAAWYHSDEYRDLAAHRRAASTANIVAVTGRD
jgi:uncharacterized protein (DUF1330 family)